MSRVIAFGVGLFARLVSLISTYYSQWLLGKVFARDEEDEENGFLADVCEFAHNLIEAISRWVCGTERDMDAAMAITVPGALNCIGDGFPRISAVARPPHARAFS